MTTERETRRSDLRSRLIEAATARIVEGGLRALRARDVTADAGTALGGLYNAFADLDDLVIHVNAATLDRLRQSIEARTTAARDARDTLRELALAYLAFARENHALWSALFEHRLAPGREVPDWYNAAQAGLIEMVARPLRALLPDLDANALPVRARTVFAAVHGIVSISLEDRFVGIDAADLEGEMLRFVDALASGLERGGG